MHKFLFGTSHLIRLSASCTHVSGLLHALAALAPTQFPPSLSATGSSTSMEESEENLPVTSYPCHLIHASGRQQEKENKVI